MTTSNGTVGDQVEGADDVLRVWLSVDGSGVCKILHNTPITSVPTMAASGARWATAALSPMGDIFNKFYGEE